MAMMGHEEDGKRPFEAVTKAQSRFSLSPGERQIVLVRHGSTVGPTVQTVALGDITITDPELTQDGHVQAKCVGEALSRSKIDSIFVTPVQRTHDTAAPLVAATGIAPQVVEDLREIYLGDYEHTFYEHAARRAPEILAMVRNENWESIPRAEAAADFAARVRKGMETVLASVEPGHTSVVFSHAGTIAEICRQATDSRPFAFMSVENASFTRLIITPDGRWKLRCFNETAHL